MTYLRRAVKYFIQICITLGIILGVLMLLGLVSTDVNVAFTQGWKSVWIILGLFAGVSAIYPLFGYSRRRIDVTGEPAEFRPALLKAMERRGYRLEKEEDRAMTFRLVSPLNRLTRLYEDRITLQPVLGGLEAEGLSRDLARAVSAIEYQLRNNGN